MSLTDGDTVQCT